MKSSKALLTELDTRAIHLEQLSFLTSVLQLLLNPPVKKPNNEIKYIFLYKLHGLKFR